VNLEQQIVFDVLGLGAVAVDDLLYVDTYPSVEQKVRVNRRRHECGGQTGTGLVAAARLGAKCGYAGVLGRDALSSEVAGNFAKESIDLSHCVWRSHASPAHSTIVVEESRNTRTIFSSVDGLIGADPELPSEEIIKSARVLLVDHHGIEGTIRAARIARSVSSQVVADFERDPGSELFGLVAHLIVNEHFAIEKTKKTSPAAAAESLWDTGRAAVVVTCGANGCWFTGEETNGVAAHFAAFDVTAVDTTGCGDVFHGAYSAALAEGMDLLSRVKLATAAAALKSTRHGGQSGIPVRIEVEEFLADRMAY